jgi:hypothetical protein
MLNKKFIIDWAFGVNGSWSRNAGKLSLKWSSNVNKLEDLIKVLCNLTGMDYNKTVPMRNFVDRFEGLEPGKWYENGFFEIRGYKKGTMHLKFTSDKIWEQLNRAYAKIKGEALPETTWKHKEQTETRTTESKPKTTKQPKTTAETNPIVQALIQQPINSETILNMFN